MGRDETITELKKLADYYEEKIRNFDNNSISLKREMEIIENYAALRLAYRILKNKETCSLLELLLALLKKWIVALTKEKEIFFKTAILIDGKFAEKDDEIIYDDIIEVLNILEETVKLLEEEIYG